MTTAVEDGGRGWMDALLWFGLVWQRPFSFSGREAFSFLFSFRSLLGIDVSRKG